MEREKQVALLSECIELAEGKKPFMSDEEALIPVARYLDEARFERERELFRFARFEGALSQWHRRLEERLGRGWAAAR